MKLTWVRVTDFKSVLDSEWFSVGELTCLVGKNESGKTALLEALERINSVRPERKDFQETEYPRMNWSEYEESAQVATAVSTTWELSVEELLHLVSLTGTPDAVASAVVTVSKDYQNQLHWDLPIDLTKTVRHAIESSGLDESERETLATIGTGSDLLKALSDIPAPSPQQEALLKELQIRWTEGGIQATAITYLKSRLPNFVYYSHYDRLPGRVSLNQLLNAQQNGDLESIEGSRVFLALLSMVGTTPELINQIDTSEGLIAKLEAVENRLSRRIFKYWSQNRHLKVRFRFDVASPSDPAPFDTGKVFQTRIENTRHEATIRLDERSAGFIWFFSFLVWFSEVQRQFGDNLIVLLDEPGLTLHARAQSDLLRYIREELLPKYQVIYSTHSPFMIDSRNLLACRTVEDVSNADGEVLGTKVGDEVLSSDGDTLFPLQAALGYDITQTLFIGENCLLVEGPSDLLYLQWASDQLRSQGRNFLDPRWTITPCGGITKIPSFLALFGGNKLHVAALTDYGEGDKKKVRELRESELLREGHVFTAESFAEESPSDADTEDIFGRTAYVRLVNLAYSLEESDEMPVERSAERERLTVESTKHFNLLPPTVPEYDHFVPARYLIEHPSCLGDLANSALNRFASLFDSLDELID